MAPSYRIESHLTHYRKLWEQSLRRSQEGPSPREGVLTLPSLSLLRLTLPAPIPTPLSFSRERLKEPALQMQYQKSGHLIGLHPLQTSMQMICSSNHCSLPISSWKSFLGLWVGTAPQERGEENTLGQVSQTTGASCAPRTRQVVSTAWSRSFFYLKFTGSND